VPGKEKIITGKNSVEDFFVEKDGSYYNMGREGADVGQAHEDGPDQGKERDTFHHEGHAVDSIERYPHPEKSQKYRAPDENHIHVIYSGVGEDDVRDVARGGAGDVAAYEKLHNQADRKQNSSTPERDKIIFISEIGFIVLIKSHMFSIPGSETFSKFYYRV
jgi:hypothetical protein